MSDHISPEELSAFVDGEARNGSKVRLHVEQCEHCAAKLQSLRQLSGSFKSLEEPDVHPAFATRVRAMIEERGYETQPITAYRWVFSLSSIAALTLLSVTLFSDRGVTVDPSNSQSSETVSIAEAQWKSILEQDESEIALKLESSLAREWADSAIAVAPHEVAAADSRETETAVLSVALSNTKPEVLRTGLLVRDSDSTTEISRMSASQSELFKQMLVMHAREEILGDNGFEG